MSTPRAALHDHVTTAERDLEQAAALLQLEPDVLEMRYAEREIARTYLTQALIALANLQAWIERGARPC